MKLFTHKSFDEHEDVHFFSDSSTGLRVIIAIHNTNLGPAAGGTRFWTYDNEDSAVEDALNLSRAMSYKNAMADIPFGGGKAVILRPKGEFDRAALFQAYGRCVSQVGGRYYTAEDVGVTPDDMKQVRSQTSYVAGLDEGEAASGDPSPVTADGVFRGLQAAVKHKYGYDSLAGLKVAVQGLGHVGYNLCERLHVAGAVLIVTDINSARVKQAEAQFGAVIVSPDEIYGVEADIFVPCALGGAINPDTIKQIQAKIIGGAANNQLSAPNLGDVLRQRHILYCPDYVINGGGIINVAAELSGEYNPEWVDAKLEALRETLSHIFKQSDLMNKATNRIADELAQQKIYSQKKYSQA